MIEKDILWSLKKGNWTFAILKMGNDSKKVWEPLLKNDVITFFGGKWGLTVGQSVGFMETIEISVNSVIEKGNEATLNKAMPSIANSKGRKTALKRQGEVFVLNGWSKTPVFAGPGQWWET